MQITPDSPRPSLAVVDSIGDILVADDDPLHRELLSESLRNQGFTVRTSEHGQDALDACHQTPPDAILLDVMMPGIDGIEACRRLKAAPATAHIPVLLITALSDRADRLRGIAAGANDFVTKPVDFEDLQFRVRNSIRIKRLYDRLLEDNEKLRGVQSLRDSLTHLVVHDMRDPLQRLDAALTNLKKSRPNDGDETSAQSLNVATSATATLDVLCQSLLDLNRLQLQALRLNQTPTDLLELARRAAAVNRPLAAARNVTLESPKGALPVVCDPQVMYRVLFILIWNGLAHAPDHSTVTVQVRQDPDHCMLSVTDQGPRIPDAYLDMVFDLLRQTRLRSAGQGRSAGPGLAYCRLAVQAHAGDAGCRSDANGTHFWFTIPATRT